MYLNFNDLLVAGIVGVGLAVYLLFMIGWCVYQHLSHQQIPHHRLNSPLGEKSFAFRRINRYLVSSFKYRKGGIDIPEEDEASDADCVICLLGFEDGEDLQKLPRCNHSFHAPCIDMWLYSHPDCPLCREQMRRSSRLFQLWSEAPSWIFKFHDGEEKTEFFLDYLTTPIFHSASQTIAYPLCCDGNQ